MPYSSINPSDGKILKNFEEMTDIELETKLVVATTCFATWRLKTYAERGLIIARAAAFTSPPWAVFGSSRSSALQAYR